jgi:hypothetical protein
MDKYAKYNTDRRLERTCLLLRPGDAAILQAHYRGGASAFIRNLVAKECDKLMRQQRKAQREQRRQWQAIAHDPNF